MPLYLTWECCKCKKTGSQSLWSISRNHKYHYRNYVCQHFDISIDTVSSIGFFGIGWKNEITVEVYYKKYCSWRTVINRPFCKGDTEDEDYVQCDNIVFQAKVSDYSGLYPTCGNSIQNRIEYNERMEQQRREEEERKRKCKQDIKQKLAKLFGNGKEEKKEEEKKEEQKVMRKTNRLHKRQKMIQLNYDLIFDEKREKRIAKSA